MLFLNNRISDNKKVYIALCKLYGIGLKYSKNLCARVGINSNVKIKELKFDHFKLLSKYINSECYIDKELKNFIINDVKIKIKIKSYQGIRHLQGLPVNGQNTKNNSKTAKVLLRKITYDR